MQTIDADGLCLRATDWREQDKLITLYLTGKGKITVSAKGCKSPKAKLKFAASPLCFGHYYLSCKGGRYVLTGCDCHDSFFQLTTDIEAYYCAMSALELLDRTANPEEYQNNLFIRTLEFLNELCYTQNNPKRALFAYLGDAVSMLGYRCNAIRLADYYRFFRNNLDIDLRALHETIAIVSPVGNCVPKSE